MTEPRKTKTSATGPGRFAYDGLDRVIHEKARLGILTSLAAHPRGLAVNDLKKLCSLTDGNLSRHLQILVEAGLVVVEKGHKDNRPLTACRISAAGRRRLADYVAVLEQVLTDAAAANSVERRTPTVRPGLSQA